MRTVSNLWLCVFAALLAVGRAVGSDLGASAGDCWPLLESPGDYARIEIEHPLAGAVIPFNLPAPVLCWKTNVAAADSWVVGVTAGGQKWLFEKIRPMWRPPETQWQRMKEMAKGGRIEFVLAGYRAAEPRHLQARSSVHLLVAPEALETPLFYREVNLPFIEAVKDPSQIRWRFGSVGLTNPPVVLEKLPVCGNCHSFSRKGEYLAMDVDYANSKASYVITKTAPEMHLATSDIITWDDYRREDGQQTFGLLSQISPDGRYVLSTVKDRSVFVPRPDLAFSQLFFPLKGILALYDRQTREFSSLPGANDPAFVQSNPAWSPDGRWIVFARNTAAELEKAKDDGRILLTPQECDEFLKRGKQFRYDLYRIPFNGGKGGAPVPLRGASANGRSNYFPKYSPDGRWIVFCQASNYMLLQPDSELFILPAEGGEPRRLACNLSRMNSWHTWSPDGRWLVFSSKAHSDYTQLYLARINEQGEASPAVWLAHMVAPHRAANIPEFVDLPPDFIVRIREQFLDDYSFVRAGNEFYRAGEADRAIEKYRQALSLNPENSMAHQRLGFLLYRVKQQRAEAIEHMSAAVRLEPRNPFARFDLGSALSDSGDVSNAVVHLAEAVNLLPNGYDRQYNALDLNYSLAQAYYQLALYSQCIQPLTTVLRLAPEHPRANYLMAMARAWMGETDTADPFYEAALRADPALKRLPDYFDLISRNYANQGAYAQAQNFAEAACQLARHAPGRESQAAKLKQRAEYCRQQQQAGLPAAASSGR